MWKKPAAAWASSCLLVPLLPPHMASHRLVLPWNGYQHSTYAPGTTSAQVDKGKHKAVSCPGCKQPAVWFQPLGFSWRACVSRVLTEASRPDALNPNTGGEVTVTKYCLGEGYMQRASSGKSAPSAQTHSDLPSSHSSNTSCVRCTPLSHCPCWGLTLKGNWDTDGISTFLKSRHLKVCLFYTKHTEKTTWKW